MGKGSPGLWWHSNVRLTIKRWFDYTPPMNTPVFEALADENRIAIVELLAGGERCVCDVSGALGISNALASHHLKKLREAGLVATRRKGAWLRCRLEEGAIMAVVGELQSLAQRGAAVSAACCDAATCCGEGDGDE